MSPVCKFAVSTLVGLLCIIAAAQKAQPQSAQDTKVHIVAQVRQLTGDPLRGMRPGDFSLSNAGTPLSFQMNRSHDPSLTSVLIIVSSSSGFDSLPKAAGYLLKNVPSDAQSHSLLSILGPHSEFVNLQPARNALNMLKSGTFSHLSLAQAAANLAKSNGPRAIIYLTNRLANPPTELENAAQDADALIYDVGGDEDENYIYSGMLNAAGPRNGASWDGAAEQSIRTVYVEPSMQKAFKQMARVSLGRYRFTVDVPASIQTLQLRLKTRDDYQIEAYAYTDTGGPPPALALSTSRR